MRTKRLVLLTAAFALSRVASGFAAEGDIDIADRVQKIDSYVRKIEQNQTLVRKEVKLDPGSLKDVMKKNGPSSTLTAAAITLCD